MIYTISKKILTLWFIVSWLILAGCASKPVMSDIAKEAPQGEELQQGETTPTNTDTKTTVETTTYTLQDIQSHNTKTDCWTNIEGKIYDLTTAFGKHKWWDEKLALLCGIDWTTKFNTQHWTNPKARSRLNTLQIWTLKQ